MGRGFPRTSDREPVVLQGRITVVLTSNDLPREALEIARAFIVRGVLCCVLCSKLLERKFREVIDAVVDP